MTKPDTKPARKTSAELKIELMEAERIAKELSESIAQTRQSLETMERQHREMVAERSRYSGKVGTIQALRDKLEAAKRYEADLKAPRVVWLEGQQPWQSWDDERGPWVVWKVTPKRLYVRRMGDEYGLQYKLDGSRCCTYHSPAIDVNKTFGESPE